MLLEAILHKPYSEYAYPEDENTLVIRIRTGRDDVDRVVLHYHDKYDTKSGGFQEMEKRAASELFDFFQIRLKAGIKRFKYMFCLIRQNEVLWYNATGFSSWKPEWSFFSYSHLLRGDVAEFPSWLGQSVVYQAFPDRFCNPQYPSSKEELGQAFFGGTLEGIRQKVGYLKALGVNVLYLNPIFSSGSYHRYDTMDYYSVDARLGGDGALKDLVDTCHGEGIRILLDGVFNHCSSGFFAFQDVLRNGEKSGYGDWFLLEGFPVTFSPKPNFYCFGDYGGMPKLNTANREVQDYFIGVAVYWVEKFGIDGWRFDVADEIDRHFWHVMKEAVRAVSGDVVLIGEIWDDGCSWMNEKCFHTLVNYPLKSHINDLIAYGSVDMEGFRQRVDGYLMGFQAQAVLQLINVISTHDTPRFLTLCGSKTERFLLGVLLQYTLPGVPLIYYGDEIGMCGEGDPDCRKPMLWEEASWDKEILSFYRFLAELRKQNPALICGELFWAVVRETPGVLAFRREAEGNRLLVVMNTRETSADCCVVLGNHPETLVNLVDGKVQYTGSGEVHLQLEAYTWRVFRIEIWE